MEWHNLERPGYFGKKKHKIIDSYNGKYGIGKWRIMWRWKGITIPFRDACTIYEDGYYADSFRRETLWKKLVSEAKEVFDLEENDVESGLDYSTQKGIATHLQDIAIRRVIFRRGWKFEGKEMIRIRHHDNYWGKNLSPGKVKFHLPDLIVVPHLEGWWDYNSVEDFYQSNKIIQVKP
jgi:hypothetical protein